VPKSADRTDLMTRSKDPASWRDLTFHSCKIDVAVELTMNDWDNPVIAMRPGNVQPSLYVRPPETSLGCGPQRRWRW
jgi:hypothetical protein